MVVFSVVCFACFSPALLDRSQCSGNFFLLSLQMEREQGLNMAEKRTQEEGKQEAASEYSSPRSQ